MSPAFGHGLRHRADQPCSSAILIIVVIIKWQGSYEYWQNITITGPIAFSGSALGGGWHWRIVFSNHYESASSHFAEEAVDHVGKPDKHERADGGINIFMQLDARTGEEA